MTSRTCNKTGVTLLEVLASAAVLALLVNIIIGVMLVVLGSIALANVLLPGWALGVALGPAFLVALGIALLVGSARRTTSAQ